MHRIDFDDRSERTLGRILRRQAELHGDSPFLLSETSRWTFAEVDAAADAYAGSLHELGVRAGDTVALLMESSPELIALTFGVNRLGAIWVPTNTDYKGEWLHDALVDSRARVLVTDAGVVERVGEVGELPFDHVVVHGTPVARVPGGASVHDLVDLRRARLPVPDGHVRYDHTAAVLWTSGTTGRPKGVMQSHNAWIHAALSGAASMQTSIDDVLYCCLPLHNSGGWIGIVYRALVVGIPFGLDARFSVSEFWDRTRFYGATQTFTLGAMHMFLWRVPERADDADNPVRCMGAIPMPDPFLEPFKRRFGIDMITQGYGQSEVMAVIARVDDGSIRWNANAAGVPVPGIEVKLLGDDDDEVATGEVGEFCVRPTEPSVMFNGYFHDPAATLEAERNLWYHTGDLGRCDDDGQFHFVDRKDDYIRFKGRSISSFAIEAVVGQHPSVAEAAAFGIASDALASEAETMVTVVLQPGATLGEEELARFVNDHAPYFFVPRYVEIVDELPHTPTGRVQKFKLRQRGVTRTTWDGAAAGFEVTR
jgi:crotonobetaine/carnitine-CoA ligase